MAEAATIMNHWSETWTRLSLCLKFTLKSLILKNCANPYKLNARIKND